MDPTAFLQGRSRETTIVRDAQGRWFQDGIALSHPNLARSFDRWIARAEDGRYCLKNEINWAYITLEGAPVFVRSLGFDEHGAPWLLLSNDRREELDGNTLRQGVADQALYCTVSGNLTARFDSSAATQLEGLLGEDEQGVYLAWSGQKFYPPMVSDPIR